MSFKFQKKEERLYEVPHPPKERQPLEVAVVGSFLRFAMGVL